MNDKKKESKVSYSAIAGELRKSARLYEVFKHASEAADKLALFEKEEETAKRRLLTLTKELASLDEACDASYNEQKKAEEAKSAADVEAGITVQKARKEADEIKRKANEAAAKIKEDNEGVLEGINAKIVEAKAEMQKALNTKADALSSLAKVEKQVKDTKAKFLKTLG